MVRTGLMSLICCLYWSMSAWSLVRSTLPSASLRMVNTLPVAGCVGTSSLRRAAQVETLRGPFRMVGVYDGARFKECLTGISWGFAETRAAETLRQEFRKRSEAASRLFGVVLEPVVPVRLVDIVDHGVRAQAFQQVRFVRRRRYRQHPRAARADGMAQSRRPAMDVDLFVRDAEVAHGDHGDAGEGFVDFEQVDLADAPAGFLQRLAHGGDGGGGELARLLRMGGVGDDAGDRLDA